MRQHTLLANGFPFSFRSLNLEDLPEHDEENMDEDLVTHSPEPPEPVESDDIIQTDENSQPGRLHPEQDLPHIFKVSASHLTHKLSSCFVSFKTLFDLMMEFNFYNNVIIADSFSIICLTLPHTLFIILEKITMCVLLKMAQKCLHRFYWSTC